MKKVILETDIGTDIDDTWALGMMLNCPELNPLFVSASTGDSLYRARLSAKILERMGRSDIPVAVGNSLAFKTEDARQGEWLGDYKLEDYSGRIVRNAVAEYIRQVEAEDEVTVIAIDPVPTLADFCSLRPDLVKKCHFVGMFGSIAKNFNDKDGIYAECNVVSDIESSEIVFNAPWKSMTITPLDTCGSVVLEGDNYRIIKDSAKSIPRVIIENYENYWRTWSPDRAGKTPEVSSILFDTVAVYLAFADEFLEMETMKIKVDDEGYTRVADDGKPMNVAIRWKDKDAFYKLLIERLLK